MKGDQRRQSCSSQVRDDKELEQDYNDKFHQGNVSVVKVGNGGKTFRQWRKYIEL